LLRSCGLTTLGRCSAQSLTVTGVGAQVRKQITAHVGRAPMRSKLFWVGIVVCMATGCAAAQDPAERHERCSRRPARSAGILHSSTGSRIWERLPMTGSTSESRVSLQRRTVRKNRLLRWMPRPESPDRVPCIRNPVAPFPLRSLRPFYATSAIHGFDLLAGRQNLKPQRSLGLPLRHGEGNSLTGRIPSCRARSPRRRESDSHRGRPA
jgi:hypothetical protein